MRCAAAAVLLFGCGRIGFDASRTVTGDGTGPRDALHIDASPACAQFGAFQPPVKLPAIVQSAGDDWDPTPSADGLLLYFYICGAGGPCSLYFSTRPSLADPFTAPVRDSGLLVAGSNQVSPTLTGDGLKIIYASDATGAFHLMESKRSALGDAFAPGTQVPNVSSASLDRDAFMTADGHRLVFVSTRVNPGGLFEAQRDDPGATFSSPIELAELDTAGTQISPSLSADGLEIFFSSNRSGGMGGFDVYRSHRAATDQPFDPPALVPELSSSSDDLGVRLSEDGATIYLDYNTTSSGGANADLSMAKRTCI